MNYAQITEAKLKGELESQKQLTLKWMQRAKELEQQLISMPRMLIGTTDLCIAATSKPSLDDLELLIELLKLYSRVHYRKFPEYDI